MLDPEIIYKLENVQRYYFQKAETIKAVDEISLEVKKGEFIVILGPSGSGKSTLLNLLSGLDSPTGGKIYFKGQDLSTLNDSQLCDIRRKDIGIIFQFYNMHPAFTAQENVEYPLMIANVPLKDRQTQANHLLTQMGLDHKKDNYPSELSGGEKQRIGIVRALVSNPDVIIADEPTGDLDSENAEQIIEILLKFNQEQQKTIIMVTHDEDLVTEQMKRIEMIDGQLK